MISSITTLEYGNTIKAGRQQKLGPASFPASSLAC
jgi:hypothetical protein